MEVHHEQRTSSQRNRRFRSVRNPLQEISIGEEEGLGSVSGAADVDVEQVGTFRRFAAKPNPRKRIRPARPGCSVGYQDPTGQLVMAGTFGAVVTDGATSYVLSNNHVLADENKLPLGSPIFQPGLLDGGNPSTDAIASLTKFIPLDPSKMNTIDCAIAEATKKLSKNILFIGAPKGTGDAAIDMHVHKFGRTTGYSAGRITSVETDVSVGYEMGTVQFANQILIVGDNAQPFSAGGDSGSLILERGTNRAVALLFAGSTTHTIANHLGDVLAALGVTLA